MKFLDANIFIYAYYKPRIELSKEQKLLKTKSKEIVKEINEGKLEVLTTAVHLSEVSNILKRSLSATDLESLLMTLYSMSNVKIEGVSSEDYLLAIDTASELELDSNDALAIYFHSTRDLRE